MDAPFSKLPQFLQSETLVERRWPELEDLTRNLFPGDEFNRKTYRADKVYNFEDTGLCIFQLPIQTSLF